MRCQRCALFVWFLLGCGPGLTVGTALTPVQAVCESVDECAQGGDNDWLQRCAAAGLALDHQAGASHCAGEEATYYRCAAAAFQCQGTTPLFPGCDRARAALATCLSAASAQSACAAFATATASCPSPASPQEGPGAAPCSIAAQCEAHCYLTSVAHACTPALAELGVYALCAASCPP